MTVSGEPTVRETVWTLEISARDPDPRAGAVLDQVPDLGVSGIEHVTVADLIHVRGRLDTEIREELTEVLVDDLLQTGTWYGPGDHVGESSGWRVDTGLHPGVTDAATQELWRLVESRSWPVTGVATGRRYRIDGTIAPKDRDRLIAALLANPIIERWEVDATLEAAFVPREGAGDEVVTIPLETLIDPELLTALNLERALALDEAELEAVRDHFVELGRGPTDLEIEMIAQTWSEHCSHKTFRARIRIDGIERSDSLLGSLRACTDGIAAPHVVSAFVGNAGIVAFTPDRTIALKCETHNHPSAVEPFGGANTGVGGVIRDVLGAAHQPIACTDVLCFGRPDTDHRDLPAGVFHPRRVAEGVVAGIADYGNKIGLPTVAGAVLYDDGYLANPLVYAGCIGVAPPGDALQKTPQPGDRVVVIGGRTGRDGLRGATFSSMTMDATTGDVAGASVQIGDPITEKLVMDVLVGARHLYRTITDCGAGGLSSAVGEMAEGVGCEVELDRVPLKYPGLVPWEIWLSEAQERMVLAVAPEHLDELDERCRHHGVELTDLGSFTGDGRLVVRHGGRRVADLDLGFVHDGRPRRELDAEAPNPTRTVPDATPAVIATRSPRDLLLELLAHPNLGSRAEIIRRYDHEIRGATLRRPLVGPHGDGHGDGTVLAEPLENHGLAIGIGVNPFYGLADPERMAMAVVDEAIRNLVVVGADPTRVVLLDNFSWGDPRRASTLGELVAAVDGCVQAAEIFAAPFVSGKDSLNNEFTGADGRRQSVPPTLVITAVAPVPDAAATVTPETIRPGDVILAVGEVGETWGGSHAAMISGASGDDARVVAPLPGDLPARYRAVHELIRDGLVLAAHDVSEGGLAVALAEMALAGGHGVVCEPLEDDGVHRELFAEGPGRLLLEVSADDAEMVLARIPSPGRVVAHVVADETMTLPDGSVVAMGELASVWRQK